MPKQIVILGGGFGGLYAALEFERALASRDDIEVTLVNRDNFFLFTPMLHEVAASDLDLTHIVNPIRKLLKRVRFFAGEVESLDLTNRTVAVSHGQERHAHELPFDHLVLGLGSVTNFYGLPGLEANCCTMRSLGDAIALRNRVIASLEEADFECCRHVRERCLTIAVAGGGFAGVETAAALHDFADEALRFYPNLSRDEIRIVLVHSGEVILPELSRSLGLYAQGKLAARGVDIRTGVRVLGHRDGLLHLSDGSAINAGTVVWTAGTSAHPILSSLPCRLDRGRVVVNESLAVPSHPGVWAVGDAAVVPDGKGGTHPPTAQHGLREGRTVARNILHAMDGRAPRPFRFRTLGQLASLGRRTGVANVFGINFSGFVAWWLWRTIYLSKLPRFEKKFRVALDWTLDLLFSKDLTQFHTARTAASPDARLGAVACDIPSNEARHALAGAGT